MADAKDEETTATAEMTTLDLTGDTKLESVVVLPEKEDSSETLKAAPTPNRDQRESDVQASCSSPPPLKRRQSLLEHDNNSAKRQRLDDGGNENSTDRSSKSQNNPADRRRSYIDDERGRAKRMFGALSSTLAQSRTRVTPAEKRRSEIEQKQRAKLRQEAEELAAQRRRRLAELKKQREREQWDYDREVMYAKHANEVARAQFLSTRAEPTLYYKPQVLRPEQEERIRKQVEQAREKASEEEVDFDRAYKDWRRRQEGMNINEEFSSGGQVQPVGTKHRAGDSHDSTNNAALDDSSTNEHSGHAQDPDFDSNIHTDELVEGQEDAVIY